MQQTEIIHPPLTAEDFDLGAGYTYRGVSVVEDENATAVFAFGHHDPAEYAEVVNDYDREMTGYEPDYTYAAKDVKHKWAVTLEPANSADGWYISWREEHQDHPLRFPITLVSR